MGRQTLIRTVCPTWSTWLDAEEKQNCFLKNENLENLKMCRYIERSALWEIRETNIHWPGIEPAHVAGENSTTEPPMLMQCFKVQVFFFFL